MRFDAAKILYFLLFCTIFDFFLVGPLSRVALDVPRAEFLIFGRCWHKAFCRQDALPVPRPAASKH